MRIINLFACFSIAAVSLQSCDKSDLIETDDISTTVTTQTIDAVVEKNGSYSLTLPTTASGYTIVSNTAHSASSMIVANDNNTETYEYTPTDEFVGADAVVLVANDTTVVNDGGGCNKGQGKHQPGNKKQKKHVKQHRVNVNFNVTAPATTS